MDIPSKRHFFCCSYPLGDGSVVEPGNWGRIMRFNALNQQNLGLALREYVFETVRLREFPDRPSRLACIFVCETKEDLQKFSVAANRRLDLAYEIEILDAGAKQHRACLNQVPPPGNVTIAVVEEFARAYWAGENIQHAEVLTESPIRVLAKVTL